MTSFAFTYILQNFRIFQMFIAVLVLSCRSRDDSVENLFDDDEIVGDLPNEDGSSNLPVSIVTNFVVHN